jgi:hypothetical protein
MFERIEDPRQRLLARIEHSLRSGSTDDPLTQDTLRAGVALTDFDRQVVAKHILAAIEDELGRELGSEG